MVEPAAAVGRAGTAEADKAACGKPAVADHQATAAGLVVTAIQVAQVDLRVQLAPVALAAGSQAAVARQAARPQVARTVVAQRAGSPPTRQAAMHEAGRVARPVKRPACSQAPHHWRGRACGRPVFSGN